MRSNTLLPCIVGRQQKKRPTFVDYIGLVTLVSCCATRLHESRPLAQNNGKGRWLQSKSVEDSFGFPTSSIRSIVRMRTAPPSPENVPEGHWEQKEVPDKRGEQHSNVQNHFYQKNRF